MTKHLTEGEARALGGKARWKKIGKRARSRAMKAVRAAGLKKASSPVGEN